MSFTSSFDAKEQIRQAVDIVDLAGQYLQLRREGRIYKALCPWHDDSRPSLQVNPERQSFKCWVCNIGGDIFSFMMKIENVEFREANVFDLLREMESAGERFDVIVLDPPAFAKNRASLKPAVRGYKEINLRALKLLNPGGVLVTCTCSYHVSEELFLEILGEAANDSHRRVQIIEKRMQASDHPVLLGMPETYYLKCVIARAT